MTAIFILKIGGGERIRTSETLSGLTVFKTVPIGLSGTPPGAVREGIEPSIRF